MSAAPLIAALAAVVVTGGLALPASAKDSGPAASSQEHAKPQPRDTDRVCWQEKPTGTHITKTVCSTRGELEQRQRQDQAALSQQPRYAPKSAFGH